MRVAFFGSSRFSCLVFGRLMASSHTVAAVITQPDQPAGRRLELRPTEMCADAEHCGLPVLKPERVRNNPQFRRELIAAYLREVPPHLAELDRSVANGETRQMAFSAHALKGMAANLGLASLAIGLYGLEEKGRAADLEGVAGMWSEVRGILQGAVRELEAILAEPEIAEGEPSASRPAA